jgi:tetratricopeptide (TPR) repeat protein
MTNTFWKLRLILIAAALLLPSIVRAAPEEIIYYKPDENGFIRSWLCSPEHSWDFAYTGASLDYDALQTVGGEEKAAPVEGQPAGDGKPWYEHHFRPGQAGYASAVCNFKEIGGHAWTIVYTFAYIYCDQEYKDVIMKTGSDDGLLVVLNGEEVFKIQIQRGYAVAQDITPGITFHKGWNRLLCKVDDFGGGTGLFIQFEKDKKMLVDELKICFERPPGNEEPKFVDGVTYESAAEQLLKDAIKVGAGGKLAEATRQCRHVLDAYPKSHSAVQALYQAGQYLQLAGQPDQAIATYDEVQQRFPFAKWSEDSLLAKSDLQLQQNQLEPAAQTLTGLIARFPDSSLIAEAMLKLAQVQHLRNDLDGSDQTLARLHRQFPDTVEDVRAIELLGDNQASRKNTDAARKLYQQVMDSADRLSQGKFVFAVNVQAVLHNISEEARQKLSDK